MRLLLDTCARLWLVLDDPKLGPGARGGIAGGASASVVSLWEVAIKAARGRLQVTASVVETGLSQAGIPVLPVHPRHVAALELLPSYPDHRDPFDRMLVAQAQAEGLTLLTADARLRRYPVATLPCA